VHSCSGVVLRRARSEHGGVVLGQVVRLEAGHLVRCTQARQALVQQALARASREIRSTARTRRSRDADGGAAELRQRLVERDHVALQPRVGGDRSGRDRPRAVQHVARGAHGDGLAARVVVHLDAAAGLADRVVPRC